MNALVLFYRVPPILLVAVSFGPGGKLDGKVILLHVNTGDMGGDELGSGPIRNELSLLFRGMSRRGPLFHPSVVQANFAGDA